MAKDGFYRQCTLTSQNTETVAWIAEYGAKVGNTVTLEDSDDPERHWEVKAVGSTRIPFSEAQLQARAAHEFKSAGSIANT